MLNFKCPNGLPPDECTHVPQLILNAASYFQNKQQMRKESTEARAQASHEQTCNTGEGLQDKQKQRQRG